MEVTGAQTVSSSQHQSFRIHAKFHAADLYKAIKKSHWKDVILEEDRKQAVIDDVASFFNGEANYAEFAVPWKVSISISTSMNLSNSFAREVLSFGDHQAMAKPSLSRHL